MTTAHHSLYPGSRLVYNCACLDADLPELGVQAPLHNPKEVLLMWPGMCGFAAVQPSRGAMGGFLKAARQAHESAWCCVSSQPCTGSCAGRRGQACLRETFPGWQVCSRMVRQVSS